MTSISSKKWLTPVSRNGHTRLGSSQRKAPDLTVEPKVRQTLESPSLPGVSFYVVALGAFNPPLLRQVVVLMDGTVVAGKPEPGK